MRASLLWIVPFGLLTWLIPFVVSVPFYGAQGRPVIPIGVFKSLMIVVGSATGAWLLVRLFSQRPTFKRAGFYFGEVGLRYCVIPIMSVATASAAASGRENAAR